MTALELSPPRTGTLTPSQSQRVLVAVVALAPFLANADAGIVALALPDIEHDLSMSLADAHWVTNIYVLLGGGLQLLGGRVADLIGARRQFLGALAGFALASAACAAAPTGGLLIAGRAAQAVAAALLVPAAMAVMTGAVAPAYRARAIGVWVGVGGAGSVAGIVFGGLVVSSLDWRWAFVLNLPLIALAVPLARRLLPADGAPRRARVDVGGALSLVGSLLTLVYALVRVPEHGWDPLTYGGFAVAVGLGAVFAVGQARGRHPLLPGRALRDRGLIGGSLGVLVLSAATAPVVLAGSLYLQQVLHYSPLHAALALLPLVGGVIAVGRGCRRLLARNGHRPTYLVGCALIAGGLLLLTGIAPDTHYLTGVLPGLALVGAGLPFVWMSCESAALARADRDTAGSAAGLVQAAGQIGGALGLALTITVASGGVHGTLDGGVATPAELSAGLARSFLFAAALVVLAFTVALAARRRDRTVPLGDPVPRAETPANVTRPDVGPHR